MRDGGDPEGRLQGRLQHLLRLAHDCAPTAPELSRSCVVLFVLALYQALCAVAVAAAGQCFAFVVGVGTSHSCGDSLRTVESVRRIPQAAAPRTALAEPIAPDAVCSDIRQCTTPFLSALLVSHNAR